MSPWSETGLALSVVALSAGIGAVLGRLPGRYWLGGYFIPLLGAIAFAVAIRRPDWALSPVLNWIFVGRWKVFLMGGAVAMLFSTLVSKLPRRRERISLIVLTAAASFYVGVWPCLAAALNRSKLAGLKTEIDRDGICRQSTDYTCGPAAAVTGLRSLGISAEEGELAALGRTSTATGTPPDVLAAVLNERFGPAGLRAEFKRFRDVSELPAGRPTLVTVKFSAFLDHWICVLEVNEEGVVAGDPLNGKIPLSRSEFSEKWRHIGITLDRHPIAGARK